MTRLELSQKVVTESGVNIVNCGYCGTVFLHPVGVDELTCPACNGTGDISDFPDFIY